MAHQIKRLTRRKFLAATGGFGIAAILAPRAAAQLNRHAAEQHAGSHHAARRAGQSE
jgi:hypothetical protein